MMQKPAYLVVGVAVSAAPFWRCTCMDVGRLPLRSAETSPRVQRFLPLALEIASTAVAVRGDGYVFRGHYFLIIRNNTITDQMAKALLELSSPLATKFRCLIDKPHSS
jgi:hypothetical protein